MAESASTVTIPGWAQQRAEPPQRQVKPLSPSALGGEKALPGSLPDEDATVRGTALHLLLQHLPGQAEAHWQVLAKTLVPDDDLRAEVLDTARRLILDPALAPVFGPSSLAEVAVSGEILARAAEGSIDRLVIGKAMVLAVDFKSNRLVPKDLDAVPEGILRQMGAYAALLGQVYRDRPVQVAVLWTETGQLMRLPDDMVRDALLRATSDGALDLDEAPGGA